jgi:hypothetical protein
MQSIKLSKTNIAKKKKKEKKKKKYVRKLIRRKQEKPRVQQLCGSQNELSNQSCVHVLIFLS